MAVSPSRVPSCKSVQGLPDTSAFSLRGTCERRQVLPMRLLLHLVCSRLAVILHFHSAPSRLSFSRCVHRRVCHPLSTRVLRPASVYPRHNNRLLPLQHHRTLPTVQHSLSPDPLPPTTLGKLAAHGRLLIPGMNSTNTIRILIRPVTPLDC